MEQLSGIKTQKFIEMNLLTLDEATREYLNLKIDECRFGKIKKNDITKHVENKVLKRILYNNKMGGVFVNLYEEGSNNNKIPIPLFVHEKADKKRFLSPQPHRTFLGLTKDAFFSKRKRILKPDIKFKVVNILGKNLPQGDNSAQHGEDSVISPQNKNIDRQALLSMMKKYTCKFMNHGVKETNNINLKIENKLLIDSSNTTILS